ncbi:integral membrane protein MviN [Burkholderia mallei PRL-20]|nr:integral membrane protein MviN [Burkholderia mallei PRL-20]
MRMTGSETGNYNNKIKRVASESRIGRMPAPARARAGGLAAAAGERGVPSRCADAGARLLLERIGRRRPRSV